MQHKTKQDKTSRVNMRQGKAIRVIQYETIHCNIMIGSVSQYKIRQDKIIQHSTTQYNLRQDKASQDMTTQGKTRQGITA